MADAPEPAPTTDPPATGPARDGGHKRTISLVLGFGISVLFLWLTLKDIEFAKLWDSLGGVNYLLLVVPLAMFALHFTVRAMRWGVFTKPLADVSLLDRQAATVIGFASNNILPFRLGELARAYVLTTKSGIPFPSAVTTVGLARVFDILALGVVFAVLLLVFPLEGDRGAEIRSGGYAAVVVGLGAISFLIALKAREEQALRFLDLVLTPFPERLANGIRGLIRSFLPGLEALSSVWDLGKAFGLSLVSWMLILVYNGVMIEAYGLDLPWYTSMVIVVVLAVAISVPQAPGFWGVYQYAVVRSVGLIPGVEISEEDAAGFALLLHGAQFLLTTLWGAYYMVRGHVSLGAIFHAGEQPAEAAPAPDDS